MIAEVSTALLDICHYAFTGNTEAMGAGVDESAIFDVAILVLINDALCFMLFLWSLKRVNKDREKRMEEVEEDDGFLFEGEYSPKDVANVISHTIDTLFYAFFAIAALIHTTALIRASIYAYNH